MPRVWITRQTNHSKELDYWVLNSPLTSLPVPVAIMLHLSNAIIPVMSSAWFPPDMMPGFRLKSAIFVSSEWRIVSHGLRVLQEPFDKLRAGCDVASLMKARLPRSLGLAGINKINIWETSTHILLLACLFSIRKLPVCVKITTTNCVLLHTITMLTHLIRKSHTETMLFRQYSEFPANSDAWCVQQILIVWYLMPHSLQ